MTDASQIAVVLEIASLSLLVDDHRSDMNDKPLTAVTVEIALLSLLLLNNISVSNPNCSLNRDCTIIPLSLIVQIITIKYD